MNKSQAIANLKRAILFLERCENSHTMDVRTAITYGVEATDRQTQEELDGWVRKQLCAHQSGTLEQFIVQAGNPDAFCGGDSAVLEKQRATCIAWVNAMIEVLNLEPRNNIPVRDLC